VRPRTTRPHVYACVVAAAMGIPGEGVARVDSVQAGVGVLRRVQMRSNVRKPVQGPLQRAPRSCGVYWRVLACIDLY
jgi:hypothetical protein